MQKILEVNVESCSIREVMEHSTLNCPTIPSFKEVLHDQENAISTKILTQNLIIQNGETTQF